MTPLPILIGKYKILEEIGRGGFAVVYKARDVELDRLVALKVLRPALSDDSDFVARFKQEARAAARLKHPNIIMVYDATQIDGQLVIAMQYVEGRTLRDELIQGMLPLDRVLTILEQIAAALDHAHQHDVVHRDVKPANILLEETEQGVHATLLDFGLAKAMEASIALTSQGTQLGSPEYMAPEQADPNRTKEIGPATDRYALGIVAYQLLTGCVPFPGNTPATLNAHLNLKPPNPHTLRADVPFEISEVLLKMLAKVPADRYASAQEFVTALCQATAPPVIHAIPRQTSRWVWGVLLGVLMVLAVGVILSVIRPLFVIQVLPASIATPITLIITATVPPIWTHTPSTTPTPLPTETPVPTVTPSPTALPSPTPTLGIGSRRTRTTDGMTMVYVPAGTFKMGSETGGDDEKPVHDVTLDAFWIDHTEVTNVMFEKFVADTDYKTEAEKRGSGFIFDTANKKWIDTPGANRQHPRGPASGLVGMAAHPVVQVTWNDASAYCKWAGGQLPTEAQWEYAAGGAQNYTYPWGNTFDGTRLNFCDWNCTRDIADKTVDDSYAETAPVGNYPSGASRVGALNLAGNVWEWVLDWYGAYSDSSQTNPTGPASGRNRVLRGGSWLNDEDLVRTTNRNSYTPDYRSVNIGFRCVAEGSGE